MGNKPPLYRSYSTRSGQFIINIAEAAQGKVEVYKPADSGRLIPVANINIPPSVARNAEYAIEFRNHIGKEIRKIEEYVTAKNTFESSKIELLLEEKEQALLVREDKRRLGSKGKQSLKNKKKGGAGAVGRPRLMDAIKG